MPGQTYNDSGIDRSMGLLVMGIIVVGFLFLMIAGMDEVQRSAQSVSSEPRHDAAPEPVLDFAN